MKSILFKQITQAISYPQFQKVVNKFNGDKYSKLFSSWNHLMVLLYGQLAGRTSLRDIIHSLQSNASNMYHMGIRSVSRNNLSHQNNKRDHRIFEQFYYLLRHQFINKFNPTTGNKFKFKKELKSIDSTTISLCKSLYGWAKYRKAKSGIKIHLVLDHKSRTPEFIKVTNAVENDAKPLNEIPIKSNSIYVQDRAYLCLKWLFAIVSVGSHFVIRLKTNTQIKLIKRNPVSASHRKKGICFDHEIKFTGSKKNDYPKTLRHIKYKDPETGEVYNYITDNFSLSPFTIAEIYRDRWQIELFFKKIKQNLKIKHFLGLSENAILIQLWVAMIIVLLFEWNKHSSSVKMGLKEFLSRIQMNLFSRKSIVNILNPEFQILEDTKQLRLFSDLLGQ